MSMICLICVVFWIMLSQNQGGKRYGIVTYEGGCELSVNHGLPAPQPLILTTGKIHEILLPKKHDIITLKHKERVVLACPGSYFKHDGSADQISATCELGKIFLVNRNVHDFKNFSCYKLPVTVARATGEFCLRNNRTKIEIGFILHDRSFLKLLNICFDQDTLAALYSQYNATPKIEGHQHKFSRPSFSDGGFYRGIEVWKQYTKIAEIEMLAHLLNSTDLALKYIRNDTAHFLARGHLTAKADFVYGSEQMATFYYVNAAPQWQTFNGGNWAALEDSVRSYVIRSGRQLTVYTGTYAVASLPDKYGREQQLYLYRDENNNNLIPVPKLYWKILYDPTYHAGIVFVGVNNPYLDKIPEHFIMCEDVCDKISWLTWDQKNIQKGYSYCCDVNEFRKSVDTVPEFPVEHLLTQINN